MHQHTLVNDGRQLRSSHASANLAANHEAACLEASQWVIDLRECCIIQTADALRPDPPAYCSCGL
jgi:hypothetical protein